MPGEVILAAVRVVGGIVIEFVGELAFSVALEKLPPPRGRGILLARLAILLVLIIASGAIVAGFASLAMSWGAVLLGSIAALCNAWFVVSAWRTFLRLRGS